MANVQFGGLITGLNTNAIIQGLTQAEQGPINLLQNQKVVFQAQEGVFTSLVGALAALKSSAQGLSLSTDFNKQTATSSDPTILTASADSSALAGSNDIVVDTLAKSQSIESAKFTTATGSIGTGTLTLKVGTTATPIVINTKNNTLTGLKEAINGSGAAVSASIVNVGSSGSPDYRLMLQSKQTGTANAVTVSGALSGGTDPFPGGGQVVRAAADALFSVNGLSVSRSSNTVSDVIPGVSFVLLKEGDHNGVIDSTDPSANVTLSVDGTSLKSVIQNFVDSYNAVNKIANDQFTLDPNTHKQGILGGDATLRGVIARLRTEIARPGGIGTGFKFISDIGITFQEDGSLSVDDAKLTQALQTNPNGVSNLFTLVQNGIGKRIPDTVDSFISSVNGSLMFRQKGIEASIADIDKKVARENDRIAAYQAQLTRQFTAMEQMVSQMQSQGNFLSANFSGILGSSTTQGAKTSG